MNDTNRDSDLQTYKQAAVEVPRYSQTGEADEVEEIRRVISRMQAGGFTVSKSRDRNGNESTTEMSTAVQFAIGAVARRYGLDPLMGEIYILGDKPYVSTQAMQRRAVEQGAHIAYEPASEEHRKAWDCEDDEVMMVATLVMPGRDKPLTGYGHASPPNTPIAEISRWEWSGGKKSKVHIGWDKRILRRMARTRAFRDVLGMAYGVALADADDPRLSDIGTQTAVPIEQTVTPTAPPKRLQMPAAQVVTAAPEPAPAAEAKPATKPKVAPVPKPAPEPTPEPEPAAAVTEEQAPEPEPEPAPLEDDAPAGDELAEQADPTDAPMWPYFAELAAALRSAEQSPELDEDQAGDCSKALDYLLASLRANIWPGGVAQQLQAATTILDSVDLGVGSRDHTQTCELIGAWAGLAPEDAEEFATSMGNKACAARMRDVVQMKTDDERRDAWLAWYVEFDETTEAHNG